MPMPTQKVTILSKKFPACNSCIKKHVYRSHLKTIAQYRNTSISFDG